MKKLIESTSKYIFLISSLVAIGAVLLICFFIFKGAYPAVRDIGLWNFISKGVWKPTDTPQVFGIYNMIAGSLCVTLFAILLGVPVGIFASVYMAKFCHRKLYGTLSQLISLLVGIPSIIYGFFGMMIIVPFIQNNFKGNGNSLFAAALVLAVMILPTIIKVSETSLRAVPKSYFEGALALGSTKEESIFFMLIPAAKSGIITGVILGIGRAIGETMAVVMVAGNSNIFPLSIFKPVRTLTSNIVLEMGYASGTHYDALIATGAVLFVFILILNIVLNMITSIGEKS